MHERIILWIGGQLYHTGGISQLTHRVDYFYSRSKLSLLQGSRCDGRGSVVVLVSDLIGGIYNIIRARLFRDVV